METTACHARPRPPVQGECCERGCEDCVWEVYYQCLEQWQAAQSNQGDPSTENGLPVNVQFLKDTELDGEAEVPSDSL